MWGLRYLKVQPEVIYVDLGTVDDRKLFDNVARRFGNTGEQLAKQAIL